MGKGHKPKGHGHGSKPHHSSKPKKKFWDTKFGRGLKKVGRDLKETVKVASGAFNLMVDFCWLSQFLRPFIIIGKNMITLFCQRKFLDADT